MAVVRIVYGVDNVLDFVVIVQDHDNCLFHRLSAIHVWASIPVLYQCDGAPRDCHRRWFEISQMLLILFIGIAIPTGGDLLKLLSATKREHCLTTFGCPSFCWRSMYHNVTEARVDVVEERMDGRWIPINPGLHNGLHLSLCQLGVDIFDVEPNVLRGCSYQRLKIVYRTYFCRLCTWRMTHQAQGSKAQNHSNQTANYPKSFSARWNTDALGCVKPLCNID
mmetsp:Transcript_73492/g.142158  ORF Transcript_73492/g.142158 Transcript_73492/m.142158 type:complete len:222 (-) Transcript_73492:97-762(-)